MWSPGISSFQNPFRNYIHTFYINPSAPWHYFCWKLLTRPNCQKHLEVRLWLEIGRWTVRGLEFGASLCHTKQRWKNDVKNHGPNAGAKVKLAYAGFSKSTSVREKSCGVAGSVHCHHLRMVSYLFLSSDLLWGGNSNRTNGKITGYESKLLGLHGTLE